MSKADYERIATALARSNPNTDSEGATDAANTQWAHDVESVARALGEDNPSFEHVRFVAWCLEWTDEDLASVFGE